MHQDSPNENGELLTEHRSQQLKPEEVEGLFTKDVGTPFKLPLHVDVLTVCT